MQMFNSIFPLKKKKHDSLEAKETLLQNFSNKSNYAEAYRTLRTNLHFAMMEKELESLLVTSAVQNEGKSNTVANLAYTIAQTGKTVLMIDCDLRKPGLTSRFASSKKNGFSSIVSEVLGRQLTAGQIADYGLLDIMEICLLQKRSCILDIFDSENNASLYFNKGKLVDVYWKNRPESKKLANTLVREKLLTKEEANLALGHQRKSVRRLGTILLSLGLVKEDDLRKILSMHCIEAFRVAAGMTEAKFAFKPFNGKELDMKNIPVLDYEELFNEFLLEENSRSYITEHIDAAIVKTSEKNLFLLPSGSPPPNPSELIGSERTQYLIAKLKKQFDVIIIDSSPVMPASDALMLAPQVDGVVVVVKAGDANRKIIKDAVDQLQHTQANILGVALNAVNRTESGYYKYYESYYGE